MPLTVPTPSRRLLKSLAAASANIPNSETVVFQCLIPAGTWRVGDSIEIVPIVTTKSGTTDGGTLTVRIGTAGTTADTSITSGTPMGASNRQFKGAMTMRLESATSVLRSGGAVGGMQEGTANTALAAVTISSAATNALYVSLTLASAGATDTVALTHAMIWMVPAVA